MGFRDRADAGRRLGAALVGARQDPVVVALPRGGVPVAAQAAEVLGAPLDIVVVRKLGYPPQPELGMGAIAEGGATVLNESLIHRLSVIPAQIEATVEAEASELRRRVLAYRGEDGVAVPVAGRDVVLVDDGLATGFTMRAAVEAMRKAGAGSVVVAVPVGPHESVVELRRVADVVLCLTTPPLFGAVGQYYDDFTQVTDAEVRALLAGAAL